MPKFKVKTTTNTTILTEQHVITSPFLDFLLWRSKNLFNSALYQILQINKDNQGDFILPTITELERILKDLPSIEGELKNDYRSLPSWTSQQVVIQVHDSFVTYFKALKSYGKDKFKFKGQPKLPHYKHKIHGRNLIKFYGGHLKLSKNGKLILPNKLGELVKSTRNIQDINELRIVPSGCKDIVIVEIMYNKVKTQTNTDESTNTGIVALDLGINNLLSGITDVPTIPGYLVNGKIIKSKNAFYNKIIAKETSKLEKQHGQKNSNRLNRIRFKRKNYIKDHLHKISKFIIQHSIENKIGTIVIGNNKEWKQNSNMGKVNNQKFLSIPHTRLIDMITYKAELVGIKVILTEESYTSKVDHLAFEDMKHSDKYLGKRKYRGLFQSSTGKLINADINGSIGIGRKVFGNSFVKMIADSGLVCNPVRVTIY